MARSLDWKVEMRSCTRASSCWRDGEQGWVGQRWKGFSALSWRCADGALLY